jgi:SpoVK/Ycf46/Vps4 family AAA+-type ATPase
MCDSLWLDRAEWLDDSGSSLRTAAEVVLRLHTSSHGCILVRARPPRGQAKILRLHPLLYEYLSLGSEEEEEKEDSAALYAEDITVTIAPLPLRPCFAVPEARTRPLGHVRILAAAEMPRLPACTRLVLQVIYSTGDAIAPQCRTLNDEAADSHTLGPALAGRILGRGSVLLLARPSTIDVHLASSLYTLVLVHDLVLAKESYTVGTEEGLYYRVDEGTEYSIQMIPRSLPDESDNDTYIPSAAATLNTTLVCPGYAAVQASLQKVLQLAPHPAAPSGILLTGPAGVGKTRLLRSLLPSITALQHHTVSIQEIRRRAATAEATVFSWLQPPRQLHPDGGTLLILDDLQVLSSHATDIESRLIVNCLLQIMDQKQRTPVLVVGLARDAATLPPELLRAGRLEVEVAMPPPTQGQREVILYHLLQSSSSSSAAAADTTAPDDPPYRHWARLLATVTAGCVASDLRCLCADAWSRSMARREGLTAGGWDDSWPIWTWDDLANAARSITPSQLALLDVTKPNDYLDVCALDDWPQIHRLSWEALAGYAAVKQRLYRTVVVPWRRQMHRGPRSTPDGASIVPPSGILFHGPSGCGKTLAANCLGSSLGLPMIKVRAADVLDQWLGESEATLRSLFARARAAAPCILFLDELDALASNRSNAGEGSDVMSRLLSTFLNEMDGVSNDPQSDAGIWSWRVRIECICSMRLCYDRVDWKSIFCSPCPTWTMLWQFCNKSWPGHPSMGPLIGRCWHSVWSSVPPVVPISRACVAKPYFGRCDGVPETMPRSWYVGKTWSMPWRQ